MFAAADASTAHLAVARRLRHWDWSGVRERQLLFSTATTEIVATVPLAAPGDVRVLREHQRFGSGAARSIECPA